MAEAASPQLLDVTPAKARLLAGAAAAVILCLTPALAAAQEAVQTGPEAPRVAAPGSHGPVGEDGLAAEELYVEADEVTEDRANNRLTARGNVQARYQGRTLRAEEIVYDTVTGLVTANGRAQIINDDGTVQYAEHVELDDKLRAGVATGFSARLDRNAKISAASAIRRSETLNELNRAIFTPCEVCAKNPEPTWSIQAERIVQDQNRKLIYYRHAVLKVKGIPVAYLPVFWHPDPSAKRASGFLTPKVSGSDRRGLSYEQPYLWVISPSQDLVVSPQINGKVNPFVNLDWRKRFYSGLVEARVGYTYEQNFDRDGDRFGDETSRSYILANGKFDINSKWFWGFSAERASDDTLFDRYDISDVYEKRGLFDDDRRRMTTQLFTVRQDERSYISVSALAFQSLRPWSDPVTGVLFRSALTDEVIRENDAALPIVAPLIEARWEPEGEIAGGRLRLRGTAVAITRDESSLAACEPIPISSPLNCVNVVQGKGVDSRRASGEADWRASYTTQAGLRVEPFLSARGDAYSVSDLPGGGDVSITRGLATAGVDIRYPLVRRFGETGTIVLEPMAQIALSPDSDLDPRIPNEDSRVLALDETNLFRPNKSPGFDIYEGGARFNVGARATVDWGDGRWMRALLGRSYRSDPENAYPPGTSLADTESDWVLAVQAQPFPGLTTWGRARFADIADFRRTEVGVNWNYDRTRGFARYFKDEFNPLTPGVRREDFQAAGEVLILENFGIVFDGTRDLQKDLWRRSEIGILYQDDCTRVELVYQRNETAVLGRTDAVFLRLNLATLGDAGYRRYDDR
jgi:LPS-assembly protein